MTPPTWTDIVAAHLERFPDAEPVDLYKLVHQASLGIGHLIDNDVEARGMLADEARDLDLTPREWEEVVEPIRPGGELVRVHLRPYLRAGGSLERLLTAMLRTQDLLDAVSLTALAANLGTVRGVVHAIDQDQRFDRRAFDVLLHDLATAGFPARHHSDAFRELYDPHYRVVLLATLED